MASKKKKLIETTNLVIFFFPIYTYRLIRSGRVASVAVQNWHLKQRFKKYKKI